MHRLRHLVQRDPLREPGGEVRLGRLHSLRVIGVGAHAVCGVFAGRRCRANAGIKHVCNELKRRDVRPEVLERLSVPRIRAGALAPGAARRWPGSHGPVTNGKGRSGWSSIDGSSSRMMSVRALAATTAKVVPRSPQSAGWLTRYVDPCEKRSPGSRPQ